MPSSLKATEIEIAQTRDLDLQRLRIQQRRTDLYAWHGDQVAGGLDAPW
jgi:hypothetical protein